MKVSLVRSCFALVAALVLIAGCDGCKKSKKKSAPRDPEQEPECATAADCPGATACLRRDCVAGACVDAPVETGVSCDNANVCDGVSRCDGKGQCVAGVAPAIDDGNPCTSDSCDPVRGPSHTPVAVDDSDVCTVDACDPTTGEVTHAPVDTDDNDDCTFDTCDPTSGVSHKRVEAFHTCDASCGDGFHTASRARNPRCGSTEALETFCVPDCGPSFYSCDSSCPPRYQKKAETTNAHCGSTPPTQVFCVREP